MGQSLFSALTTGGGSLTPGSFSVKWMGGGPLPRNLGESEMGDDQPLGTVLLSEFLNRLKL